MDNRIWMSLLLTLVLGSALTVIYVKHQSRVLFAELRGIQKQQDQKYQKQLARLLIYAELREATVSLGK